MAKHCYFCTKKILINFKDVETLRQFINPQFKIKRASRTNLCAKHQTAISRAIKTARRMALLPFTDRHIKMRFQS